MADNTPQSDLNKFNRVAGVVDRTIQVNKGDAFVPQEGDTLTVVTDRIASTQQKPAIKDFPAVKTQTGELISQTAIDEKINDFYNTEAILNKYKNNSDDFVVPELGRRLDILWGERKQKVEQLKSYGYDSSEKIVNRWKDLDRISKSSIASGDITSQ